MASHEGQKCRDRAGAVSCATTISNTINKEYVVEGSGFTVKSMSHPLKTNFFDHFMMLTDCKRHMLSIWNINMFISLT